MMITGIISSVLLCPLLHNNAQHFALAFSDVVTKKHVAKTLTKDQRPQSDVVIHVGNLDWNTPSENIAALLHTIVGIGNADVTVKELSHPRKKRDERKLHGGSATVSFGTREEAQTGMDLLNAFPPSVSNGKKELRLRWALIPKEPAGRIEETLSAERIQHRKNRAEGYARQRRRIAEKTESLLDQIGILENTPVLEAPVLDWSQVPEEIDPVRGGGLQAGTKRGLRKKAAVEAFLHVCKVALLDEDRTKQKIVADLGCGAGNLSLPLAWWLAKEGCTILGVDINSRALARLSDRAKIAGITSISTMEQDLLRLMVAERKSIVGSEVRHHLVGLSDCSAVVSLHACGAASDLAMASAISHSLPFAISPCCIGKVNGSRIPGRMPSMSGERSAAPQEISYPRSRWLDKAVSFEEYQLLAAAADYGVGGAGREEDVQEFARRLRCKRAKQIIETDRLRWAEERGYQTRMVELPRIGPLYPKRELLLGAPMESKAAAIIRQLDI